MRGIEPVPDDPRQGIMQQELFTTLHDKPALLRQIPWETRGGRRGVMETHELERQALINDFEFHSIPVQVRIANLAVLRDIYGDPEMTELRVVGPGRLAWAMPQQAVPDDTYTLTTAWQDVPAFFANWLNHRAAEDPLLGASWARMVRVRTRDDNGEESVRYREEPRPARRLLAWRMPADQAAAERDSELVLPSSARVPAFLADAEEDTPAPADAPAPAAGQALADVATAARAAAASVQKTRR